MIKPNIKKFLNGLKCLQKKFEIIWSIIRESKFFLVELWQDHGFQQTLNFWRAWEAPKLHFWRQGLTQKILFCAFGVLHDQFLLQKVFSTPKCTSQKLLVSLSVIFTTLKKIFVEESKFSSFNTSFLLNASWKPLKVPKSWFWVRDPKWKFGYFAFGALYDQTQL